MLVEMRFMYRSFFGSQILIFSVHVVVTVGDINITLHAIELRDVFKQGMFVFNGIIL